MHTRHQGTGCMQIPCTRYTQSILLHDVQYDYTLRVPKWDFINAFLTNSNENLAAKFRFY